MSDGFRKRPIGKDTDSLGKEKKHKSLITKESVYCSFRYLSVTFILAVAPLVAPLGE